MDVLLYLMLENIINARENFFINHTCLQQLLHLQHGSNIYPFEILLSKHYFLKLFFFFSASLRIVSHNFFFEHCTGNGSTVSDPCLNTEAAPPHSKWGQTTVQPPGTSKVWQTVTVAGWCLGHRHQARLWASKQRSSPRERFSCSSVL